MLSGAAVLLSLVTACHAPASPPRMHVPLGDLALMARVELATYEAGLAHQLVLTTELAPLGPDPVLVHGMRPRGEPGDNARIITRVSYVDYPGRGPLSSGKTLVDSREWGPDEWATAEVPLSRAFLIELPAPPDVLARRVEITVVLHPVDLVEGELRRNGGRPVVFPTVELQTFATERPVERPDLWPSDSTPEETFLWAASGPDERLVDTVDQLVAVLGDESLDVLVRDGAVAGLVYLTRVSHGRDVGRWQDWWAQQQP